MSRLSTAHLVLSLLVLGPLAAADDPGAWPAPAYSGFRGDGLGHYADCTPPLEWAVADFAMVRESKKAPRKRIDGWKPKNVVWQQTLPSWSLANFCLAKGRLFALSEVRADSVSVNLHCLDPATGEILWTRDIDTTGLLPPAEAKTAREALLKRNRDWFAFQDLRSEIMKALGDQRMVKDYPSTDALLAKLGPLADKLRAYGLDPTKERMRGFVAGVFEVDCMQNKVYAENCKQLRTWGYPPFEPWFCITRKDRAHDGIGIAPATPCTDGEAVYVATGFLDFACYDLDGKLRWQRHFPPRDEQVISDIKSGVRASMFPSPIVVDDLAIFHNVQQLAKVGEPTTYAVDTRTGETRWTVAKPDYYLNDGGAYFLATPVVATVDGIKLLCLATGQVVDTRNGKQLIDGPLGFAAHARPMVTAGDVLIIGSGSEGGSFKAKKFCPDNTTFAYRLQWEDAARTKLAAKEFWRLPNHNGPPVVVDGKVYVRGKDAVSRVDLATGKAEAAVKPSGASYPYKAGCLLPDHVMDVAGDYLIGRTGAYKSDGWCIYRIAPAFEHVANVQATGNAKNQYSGYSCWSGNRMFIRDGDDVYCIGDPAEPLRLSMQHRP